MHWFKDNVDFEIWQSNWCGRCKFHAECDIVAFHIAGFATGDWEKTNDENLGYATVKCNAFQYNGA